MIGSYWQLLLKYNLPMMKNKKFKPQRNSILASIELKQCHFKSKCSTPELLEPLGVGEFFNTYTFLLFY